MPTIASYALIAVADAKEHLGISASTYDDLLTSLINEATDFIENQCGGRRFKVPSTAVTEYYEPTFPVDGPGGQKEHYVTLKQWPVTELTSVKYKTAPGVYTAYDSTGYELYEDEGQIYLYGGIPRTRKAIQVVYKAGYSTIPYDLQLACRKLVGHSFGLRKAEGRKSESVGGASIVWKDDAVDSILKDIIAKYTRLV